LPRSPSWDQSNKLAKLTWKARNGKDTFGRPPGLMDGSDGNVQGRTH